MRSKLAKSESQNYEENSHFWEKIQNCEFASRNSIFLMFKSRNSDFFSEFSATSHNYVFQTDYMQNLQLQEKQSKL